MNRSSIIGPQERFNGDLRGQGDVTVFGAFEGTIDIDGTLTIEQSGSVRAKVTAQNIYVFGLIEGHLIAHETIHIARHGRLLGDLEAPNFSMEEGAIFRGRAGVKNQKTASISQLKSISSFSEDPEDAATTMMSPLFVAEATPMPLTIAGRKTPLKKRP